jgi:hypothetical protein
MQCTLLSRFQGALLGAAIGYSLGVQIQNKTMYSQQPANPRLVLHTQSLPMQPTLALMLQGAKSLTAHGRLLHQDWVTFVAETLKQNSLDSVSEIAIATLPLMLFFHEDDIKLRQALQQGANLLASNSSQGNLDRLDNLWVFSSVFAAALREELAPRGWSWHSATHNTHDTSPLRQVQQLLETKASLETARVQLTKDKENSIAETAIPLALYCFFSTPNDFYLALCRSAYTGYHTELTCTLVGALSGVYNGITSIPLEWQLAAKALRIEYTGQSAPLFTDHSQTQAALHSRKPLLSEIVISETVQLAELLLAAWSGVFAPGKVATMANQIAAIAAPSVIRPHVK